MREEHRGVGGIFFDDLERLGDGTAEEKVILSTRTGRRMATPMGELCTVDG